MNDSQVCQSIYNKLLNAIIAHKDEPPLIASSEVLGYTGSWLSSLTLVELATLQQAISFQIVDTSVQVSKLTQEMMNEAKEIEKLQ